jgi:phosphopantetheinyl transferase (holo-ACP synthase)
MMRQIKESDWKIFRQIHQEVLERFCERILSELERVNSNRTKGFHEKYLEIWAVLKRRDREMAQAFDGIRRSTAWTQIAIMKRLGLLTEDEIRRFSEETREVVDVMLR